MQQNIHVVRIANNLFSGLLTSSLLFLNHFEDVYIYTFGIQLANKCKTRENNLYQTELR